jgi:transposase
MNPETLMQAALQLGDGWKVTDTTFDAETKSLTIHIQAQKDHLFPCPHCGEGSPVHDYGRERTWRHLNFFQYTTYLCGRLPRVSCSSCQGSPKTIKPSWTRERSGFSLYFEAFLLLLMKAMPVKKVADLVGEHDTRLWPILHHYVNEAREKEDFSSVTTVAYDETSRRRGHEYVSIFMDMSERKVLSVAEGKSHEVLKTFKEDFMVHGGHPDQVKELSIDLSPAFIKGAKEQFPKASVTFDKFHVVKLVNEAVDQTRRQEQYDVPALKKTRYLWLKNEINLTTEQKKQLLALKDQDSQTAKAYQLKVAFQRLFELPTDEAPDYLDKWLSWASRSKIEPMIKVAKTIRAHREGILRWFYSRVTNGALEAVNGLIQAAKRQARGYRSTKNLIAMIYLIAGKLSFDLAIDIA